MPQALLISVDEYLRTSFRPDCDFIDGEVQKKEDPRDQIVRIAPLICIEILSPEDTLTRLQARVDDYVAFGVAHIWVIDPTTRHAYVAGRAGFIEVDSGAFEVPGSPIRVSISELFADLDEDRGLLAASLQDSQNSK